MTKIRTAVEVLARSGADGAVTELLSARVDRQSHRRLRLPTAPHKSGRRCGAPWYPTVSVTSRSTMVTAAA